MKALSPSIASTSYVDSAATIIGQVKIGEHSSVWPGCVLRGDIHKIEIGHHSNIQDLSLVHVETDRGTRVGNYVTVGHQVTLHACTVKSGSLIGIGSIVLDGAVIGEGTILGAGSLVTHDQKLKSGSLYFGRPAKFVRKLSAKEIKGLISWAERYVKYAEDHHKGKFQRRARTPLMKI
ncbi:MAG: gamma carbonic anhydrase family protein [Candidatus Omnitrophica bacterium]|nr:gamma carbonic anhydrase family protein [Candidatus Omnitrophota bacterium]